MSEVANATSAIIDGAGYAILPGLIPPNTATDIRARILAEAARARQLERGVLGLSNLLAIDTAFETLATHPRLLALAHELLGNDARLGAFGARILEPDCEPGGLHVDYPYWAMPSGMPVSPALMLQVIWMMEPVSATNGSTWVAPGSQKWHEPLCAERFRSAAIQVDVSAGDAIVSHGLLWHRTAVNRSAAPRVAILINYTQLAIQPMTEFGPFPDGYLDNASPEIAGLLGVNRGAALRNRLKMLGQ